MTDGLTATVLQAEQRNALLLNARSRMDANDLAGARALLLQLLRHDARDEEALYGLALIAERAGDHQEAINRLNELLSHNAQHPQARQSLARLQRQQTHRPTHDDSASIDDSLARMIDKGPREVTAGNLQFEGSPLLRSCAGRFASAGAVIVLAIVLPGVLAGALTSVTGEDEDLVAALLRIVALVSMAGAFLLIAHALLWVVMTRYEIYERRIDITAGITTRSTESVWLYEITDVSYIRPLSFLLVNTAAIWVTTERGAVSIVAPGTAREVKQLFEQLRNASVIERRKMKGIWV